MAITYRLPDGTVTTERPPDQGFSLANGDTVEDLVKAGILSPEMIQEFLSGNSIGVSYDPHGRMQVSYKQTIPTGTIVNLPPDIQAQVNKAYTDMISAAQTAFMSNPDDPRYAELKRNYEETQRLSSMTPQERATEASRSAYDLLFNQFQQYGLGGLVEPLKQFITEGLSSSEFTLRLRETDAYKKRFAANQSRIQKGLSALSEAQYIALEDQYQDVMRRYGLPESYYSRGEMGRQEGFEKFIAFDVSPVELEDRIQVAQRRVLNAAPQVKDALLKFYGTDITNGDVLAYILDPQAGVDNIKRKVTAAEVGGAAARFGLDTARTRAEELVTYGVTGDQALSGYEAIGGGIQRASLLSSIYDGEYGQASAESEIFKLPSAIESRRERSRLTKQEQATFGGTTGVTGGALSRDRAGQY